MAVPVVEVVEEAVAVEEEGRGMKGRGKWQRC